MESTTYEPNVIFNKLKLQKLQDVMSLVLGIGVGVLGLESLYGFAFFLAGICLSNLSFYLICCQGESARFFPNPLKDIFLDGLFTSLSGFILMWCLTYALFK